MLNSTNTANPGINPHVHSDNSALLTENKSGVTKSTQGIHSIHPVLQPESNVNSPDAKSVKPNEVLLSNRAIIATEQCAFCSINEKIDEDLKQLKDRLLICDDYVEKFRDDYRNIRYWEHGLTPTCAKGILLSSDPGYGKTVFMDAISMLITGGDKDCLQSLKGSDLIGSNSAETTDKLIALFKKAKEDSLLCQSGTKEKTCHVFCIDEFDAAVMPKNICGLPTSAQNAARSTLQSFMDGTSEQTIPNIYLIGTTNVHIGRFDKALTRPGRLSTHVKMQTPELQNIKKLIHHCLKDHGDIEIKDGDIDYISKLLYGMTPASITHHTKTIINTIINNQNVICKCVPEDSAEKKWQISAEDVKQQFYPIKRTKRMHNKETQALKRLYPYYPDLEHTGKAMEQTLSALRTFSKQGGKQGIILIQGHQGSGKTAFLRALLDRVHSDLPTVFDGYGVVTNSDIHLPFANNVAERSVRKLHKGATRCMSHLLVIDDADWFAYPSQLPTTGEGVKQCHPSYFISRWNEKQNRITCKNQALVLVSSLPPDVFMKKSGLKGLVLGAAKIPSGLSNSDVEKVLKHINCSVADGEAIMNCLRDKPITVQQLMQILHEANSATGFDFQRFSTLIDLNSQPEDTNTKPDNPFSFNLL